MEPKEAMKRFGERVGYSQSELESIPEGDARMRLVHRISNVAADYSIEVEVVKSRNCNTGYEVGDKFLLDIDGNFITKLCPKRMCVYAVSQLVVPVALINERLSESLEPNDFHFMKQVRCTDVGVECAGYGETMLRVSVVPRDRAAAS